MKKYLLAIILVLLALSFTACGSKEKASDKAISLTNQAITTVESYLSGSTSAKSAYSKLDDICDSLSYASDYTYDEMKEDSTKYADHQLYLYVFLLESAMLKETFASADASTYAKVESALSDLKKKLKKYN